MKQDVIISISVRQDFEDSEDEVIELMTQGVMEYEDDKLYKISYKESEMTGLEGTITTFFVEKQRITLTREGSIHSKMSFESGKRHASIYDTPYGSMDVEVHTKIFHHDITAQGGDIALEYDIEISKNILGNNFFQIKVQLPKGHSPIQ